MNNGVFQFQIDIILANKATDIFSNIGLGNLTFNQRI